MLPSWGKKGFQALTRLMRFICTGMDWYIMMISVDSFMKDLELSLP